MGRTGKPKKQQMWELRLQGRTVEPTHSKGVAHFAKVIALWIPRRFLTPAGVDAKRFIEDVNEKVTRRGYQERAFLRTAMVIITRLPTRWRRTCVTWSTATRS